MIYIAGDTHIPIDIKKLNIDSFPEQKRLTKDDYVIICGDFGGVWDNREEELYWRKWLDERSFTTLFLDGNHENFDLLNKYEVNEWNGGKVHFINGSIIHLMRGQVYTINGLTFFIMGGASSVDKENRIRNMSWWEKEVPSYSEFEEGLNNLEKNNWQVDYILTHTCSSNILRVISKIFQFCPKSEDCVNQYLNVIEERTNFKHWYFGHFHKDIEVDDRHTLLFQKIIKLK